MTGLEWLLVAIVAAPGVSFLIISTAWLLGWQPREKPIARLTAVSFSVMTAGCALLLASMHMAGQYTLAVPLGNWFDTGEYHFPVTLFVDRLSVPMVGLTTVLAGIVGSFSVRYLHRERGYARFFVLLHLFAFGANLVFAAGSFDMVIAGWELVGISSVLLVAYFQEREAPVRNAIRVFAFYRIADIGLLTGVFLLHHHAETTSFEKLFRGAWPGQSPALPSEAAIPISLLFLWAACGKSAQVPFCSWLPRAMEGPTPSSAIFYGAISVHLGAYLLLRLQPLLLASPWTAAATIGAGVATAIVGTLSHRVATDAKTSLAYASMTQLGVIFVEIGLGFSWLALLHIMGHAAVRTMQFLRAPSMLHDYHRMHAAAGGHLAETGKHLSGVPEPLQLWLYRFGLERGFLDTLIDRFVASPVIGLSHWFGSLEPDRDGLPAPLPARGGSRGVDG